MNTHISEDSPGSERKELLNEAFKYITMMTDEQVIKAVQLALSATEKVGA